MSPNGATLLAAQNITTLGQTVIWRSTDGGATWASPLVAGVGAGAGINQFNAVEQVVFDPTDSSKAVASGTNGAFRSTDGGATWAVATFAPPVALGQRVELGYAASSSNILYASVQQNSGEVYKSTDGGASYNLVNTGSGLLGQQGWYDNAIWVNPLDPNFVTVGGPQFWYSRDGGVTFASPGYAADMHPDHHAIVAAPGFDNQNNKRVFVGNDGGIYRTDDITTLPFPTWTSLNTNLPITQFFSGLGHNLTGKITGGTQDNGTPGLAGGGFNSWVDWTSGDGGAVATDQTDVTGNIWYGEYVYLAISRSTTGFTPYAPGITAGGGGGCGALSDAGNPNGALFIAPFTLDPNNANRLLGGGASLWLSTNAQAPTVCWTSIKTPVAGALISAVTVKTGDSNNIWVGYTSGRIDKTTDGGGTWAQVGSGTLPGRTVTRIAVDTTDANNVYATYGGFVGCCFTSGNVWRTTDAGANWTDISAGLPAIPVFAVTISPLNHNYIYIGTMSGIFDTANALGLADAPIWSVNDGPANVAVTDLTWMTTGGGPKLLAATHGRSLWITTDAVLAVTLDEVAAAAQGGAPSPWLYGAVLAAVLLLAVLFGPKWAAQRRRSSETL